MHTGLSLQVICLVRGGFAAVFFTVGICQYPQFRSIDPNNVDVLLLLYMTKLYGYDRNDDGIIINKRIY